MYKTLTVLCIFAVVGNSYAGLNALCPALNGTLFGAICQLGVTNSVANSVCSEDCYCVHGASNGGTCVDYTAPLRAACQCDYSTPATPLNIDCALNPTNAILQVECGSVSVPLPYLTLGLLTGQQVCSLECNCFHGATGGVCSSAGTVGGTRRCVCGY